MSEERLSDLEQFQRDTEHEIARLHAELRKLLASWKSRHRLRELVETYDALDPRKQRAVSVAWVMDELRAALEADGSYEDIRKAVR